MPRFRRSKMRLISAPFFLRPCLRMKTAELRVYRQTSTFARDLIITGCVQRNDHSARSIHSLAMRAKVLGFRFYLEDEVLSKISTENSTIADD